MTSKKQQSEIKNIINKTSNLKEQFKEKSTANLSAHEKLLNETQSILYAIITLRPGINNNIINKSINETEFQWSKRFLANKKIDFRQITLDDLLSNDEIASIEFNLNRPLVERLRWDRWDYLFVFMAAIAGIMADTVFGDPDKGLSKMLSDKDSWIGQLFEKIHQLHPQNNPMDYQGPHMGGGGHRLRSIGHDLFGFIQGIRQIKNGTFTGVYYKDGVKHKIFSSISQSGNTYDQVPLAEAIWEYCFHIFCDFFSSMSLPVPGFGYLAQMPDRDIRKFAADMYNNGYNLRHMFVQGISVVVVETFLRTYMHLRYKNYKDEDKESLDVKKRELLLLAHSLVMAFNTGKVIITDPLLFNLPQSMAASYYFIQHVIFHYRNNDPLNIALRNIEELKHFSEEKYVELLADFNEGSAGLACFRDEVVIEL